MAFRVAFARRLLGLLVVCITTSLGLGIAVNGLDGTSLENRIEYGTDQQKVFRPILPPDPKAKAENQASSPQIPFDTSVATNALQALYAALSSMQNEYFMLWLGTWPTAIDWTAAVMGTHVSASLYSLSHSFTYWQLGTFSMDRKLDLEWHMVENEINKYFAQSSAYFFGEDHFAIRNQAFDDMLWVVLGWLDSVRFIGEHSDMHYPPAKDWHGRQFIPAFAHRARIFYELAEKGWDWHLCGGGMVWNPHLLPYKNAITNELFISASIAMYLHFPGDDNCSPFLAKTNDKPHAQTACPSSHSKSTYDPVYLANAVNGYEWLKNSKMTNAKGLYTDGFHIRDYYRNHSKTECDERNEMVYTYNQGVVLSGLHGLWEATGNVTYLEDGHELVRNVIRATGWTDTELSPLVSLQFGSNTPPPTDRSSKPWHDGKVQDDATISAPWAGLGLNGILTELCDPFGTCSQDGQTFKGIFFHHLTAFCESLPTTAVKPGRTHAASRETATLHRTSCNEYAPWVVKNAQAALRTRDEEGKFGMWWGAGATHRHTAASDEDNHDPDSHDPFQNGKISMDDLLPHGALDYRNSPGLLFTDPNFSMNPEQHVKHIKPGTESERKRGKNASQDPQDRTFSGDPNDRGRGRTVETQGGGVAVTRAMWEFIRNYDEEV